jgi:hypothetical protein
MIGMRKMFWAVVAAIGFGLALTGSPAFGVTFFPPVTGFQDEDLDWLDDADGSGTITVGDRLYGVIEFNETFRVVPSGASDPIAPEELTGVFDLTVTAIAGTLITFGPTAGSPILGAVPAGTMVSLYLDNVNDLDLVAVNCDSDTECIDFANNGALWLNAGFAGDLDETWTALVIPGGLDPDTVAGLPANQTAGFFNYCLSVLTNNTGQTFGLQSSALCTGLDDGQTLVLGSGNILGGQGLENGAFARSDGDAQVRTVSVPEPSALLLVGAGLLGLGFIGRHRISVKKD